MKEAYKVVSKHSKNKDIQHKNSSSRFSLGFQTGDLVLVSICPNAEVLVK